MLENYDLVLRFIYIKCTQPQIQIPLTNFIELILLTVLNTQLAATDLIMLRVPGINYKNLITVSDFFII